MKPVRILIADDHDIVRYGIRALLQSRTEWEIVWEAANGREAVEATERLKPALCILDLMMPYMNGLEATRQILQRDASAKVLIVTMHESEQLIREVLKAGARGYVLKSHAGRDLPAAIDALSAGGVFFASKVSSLMLNEFLRSNRDNGASRGVNGSSPDLLSPREREIVQLLAEGKSNKDIAAALNISVNTAETHRHRIMQKLELSSIVDLVRYAIRNQIVAP
ncbi:response regulator [Candidatus Nitrospira bockiana]